ncbi:MAG: immune inhibitor A [Planctomycetes bacterium]|nr:immune inhibitor A [Planctomycetota bacterium]
MRHAALASLLVALAAAPAAAQPAPTPPLDGFLALDDAGRRGAPRLRPERLLRLVPGLRGLAPPTTGRLRLAVVLVAFADVGPAPWGPAAFERALLSRGDYTRTPSGDPAFGSMADYYAENSGGALALEGRVFDWVRLRARRADVEPRPLVDPAGRALFGGALDALLAREGARALDDFDALAFVVAGPQATRRGSVLWPHSTAFVHRGRAWRYYLMHSHDRRGRFEAIGTHCHELGHVLGLPDKYGVGRGTGLGQWCAMATGAHGGRPHGVDVAAPPRTFRDTARELVREQVEQARGWLRDLGLPGRRRAPPPAGEARPLHLCAVCKARLGWTRPVTLDPRRGARVYLTSIEADARQVARVPLDPLGREALVLEHRRPVGFDAELPRGGLLVWRTGDPTAALRTFVPFAAVELVTAHGVRSTDAALRTPALVPFPIDGRDQVVVAGRGPGAWRVRLSGIRVDAEGRLYVEVRRGE